MSGDGPQKTTPTANGLLRHLIGAANAIRGEIGAEIEGLGHEYSPAASHLIVNLPSEGLGMSELADRLRLTPQRTGQLVQNLESFGYVERIPEPEDGRARRVVFTDRGRELLADIDRIDERYTKLVAERLGPERFARLCEDAEFLDRAFRDDDELIDLRR
ncbi:MAG: MarR family transcriptional regulator [bacterium]|nr:MarR family transcriptional regulator [bacterium]